MDNSSTPPILPNLLNSENSKNLDQDPNASKPPKPPESKPKGIRGLEQCLKKGHDTTYEILFKHFSLKLWLKIALLGLICGASWSVLLSPLPTPWGWEENFYSFGNTEYQESQKVQEDHSACIGSEYCVVTGEKKSETGENENEFPKLEDSTRTILGILILSIVGLFLTVPGLIFLWVSSQSSFVFLSLVGNKKLEVIKSFKEFKTQGNSLFLWGLLFLFLYSVPIATLAWGFCIAQGEGYGIVAIIFGLLSILVLTILMLLLSDLCLPIMAIRKLGLGKAITTAIKSVINAPLKFLLYLPIAIVIGLFISTAFYIACIPILFFAYFAGYATIMPLGLILGDGLLYMIISLLISGAILTPTFIIILLLTVPPMIFYRAFSLHYLEYINPDLSWKNS